MRNSSCPFFLRGPAAAAGLFACLVGGIAATPAAAVTITIRSTDSVGVGFNDATPVAPVGGNPGKTRGAQRRFLFQYAADALARRLKGTIPIIVSARFDNLGGTASSAVLGRTSPASLHRDFLGAPHSKTWYVAALANQLSKFDENDRQLSLCPQPLVSGHCPELVSVYNSAVDGALVLGDVDFYYGIDGKSGDDLDFLHTLLHEMGHGLGLLDLLDSSTGEEYFGLDDAYSLNLEDPDITPKQVSKMSNAQRVKAQTDGTRVNPPREGRLVWAGAALKAASGILSAGRRADGAVQIFAPVSYIPGSSVAHLNTVVVPNELMEPYLTNPPVHELALTVAMLADLGWQTLPASICGDANRSGSVGIVDALAVLRGSIGASLCAYDVCDVNKSGTLTTADALQVLRFSVGQPVLLSCPPV